MFVTSGFSASRSRPPNDVRLGFPWKRAPRLQHPMPCRKAYKIVMPRAAGPRTVSACMAMNKSAATFRAKSRRSFSVTKLSSLRVSRTTRICRFARGWALQHFCHCEDYVFFLGAASAERSRGRCRPWPGSMTTSFLPALWAMSASVTRGLWCTGGASELLSACSVEAGSDWSTGWFGALLCSLLAIAHTAHSGKLPQRASSLVFTRSITIRGGLAILLRNEE